MTTPYNPLAYMLMISIGASLYYEGKHLQVTHKVHAPSMQSGTLNSTGSASPHYNAMVDTYVEPAPNPTPLRRAGIYNPSL